MVKFKSQFNKATRYLFAPPEEGQGLVEYALLLFLICIVLIAVLSTIGPSVYNIMSNVVDFGLS